MQKIKFNKQQNLAVIFACSLALSGCGAMAPNTDKPQGIYLGGATEISGDYGVKISENAPKQGAQLTGISCKNKLWEPAPTNDAAIGVLKKQAAAAGFNTLYVSSIAPDPNALSKNCWSAIIATGLAFNS